MNHWPERILSDEQAAELLAATEQVAAAMEKFMEEMQKAGSLILAGVLACMREYQEKQAWSIQQDINDEPEDDY